LLNEMAEHALPVTHVSRLAKIKTILLKGSHTWKGSKQCCNTYYAGRMLYCQTRHAKQFSSRHAVPAKPATQGS